MPSASIEPSFAKAFTTLERLVIRRDLRLKPE